MRRPAFYALRPGGWRDLVTVLHPPYTAWHLSYVALGAAAAPQVHADRLLAALAAFFLAVGVAAHALDELNGRPLKTRLSDRSLIALASIGLAGAVGIGVAGLIIVSASLAPFVAAGAFLVVAYNLELAGGRFHSDCWFAAAWGAFPALTSWWANTLSLKSPDELVAGVLVAVGCFGLSLAQRRLSTPVRELRRRTASVSGEQRLDDGSSVPLSVERIASPLDGALRALSWAVVALAVGLVTVRL
ncbi:MAG: hypothetical protein ACRDK5_08900 [Solirubrobacterales bacterium]